MDYCKTILRGRVESDPQISSEDDGRDAKATFRLEVKSRVARKQRVDVHNIVAFGRVAESCKHLRKGRTVIVEGRPQNYKQGEWEVVAASIIFDDDEKLLYRGGQRSADW